MKRTTFNEEQVGRMVAMYTGEEKSLNAIAKEFDCSVGTVSRVLKSNGITMRPRGRRPGTKVAKKTTAVSTPPTTSTPEAKNTSTQGAVRRTFTFNK